MSVHKPRQLARRIAAPVRSMTRVSLVALSVLLIAGCGRRGNSHDKIRFVTLAWQEQAIEANRRIVAEWNADTTNTPVEYVQGTWGSIHDFLITAFETGDVPDVFHYESVHLADFARRGYLADLDPLISDDLREDIVDVAWQTVRTEGGATSGIPFLLESLVVLYNKNLFTASGIVPPSVERPWTWSDLREAAQMLTIDSDGDGATDQWGAAFGLRNSANMVMNLSLGFGGAFFEPVGDRHRVRVNQPERELLATIHGMIHVDKTASPDGVGQSGAALIPRFLSGDYAMLVAIGSWARQQVVENARADFRWGVLPPVAAESQAQGASAQTLSIPSASKHKSEAMAFIEHFLSSSNMTELARADWMIPARASSIRALADEPAEYGWATTVAAVDNLVEGPWTRVRGLAEWKSRVANPTFQEVFSDRLPINEAAERIETEGNRILSRYK